MRRSLGFSNKSAPPFRIGSYQCAQGFQRHRAVQPGVARSIHFPHAARADGCEDFIWTEMFAGRLRHRVSTDSSLNGLRIA